MDSSDHAEPTANQLALGRHSEAVRSLGVRVIFRTLASILAVLVSLILCELGLRVFCPGDWIPVERPRNLFYRYDETLGWFPRENTTVRFTGTRTVTLAHNSKGFRGNEHVIRPGAGVMFLGDSYVWGFDVEASERFTEKLQARHSEWGIYNLGVSGYGTDQEFLLLQRYFDQYRPRVVFLVFCSDNDREDNCWNYRYGEYYKPYYTREGKELRLNAVPVPRSERAVLGAHERLSRLDVFRLLVRVCCRLTNPLPARHEDPTSAIVLAMRDFVQQKGAHFIVGLQYPRRGIVELLTANHIPFLDLNTTNRYATFGGHWTPAGHDVVSQRIEQALVDGNYLPQEK